MKNFLQSEKFIALGIFALATLVFASSGIFYKISELELSSTATVFNRFWIATVVFGVWFGREHLILAKQPEEEKAIATENSSMRSTSLLILFLGIVNLVDHLVWAHSFTLTNIANCSTLHNTIVPFSVLISWLIFKEVFGGKYLLGVAIAILGAIALLCGDFNLQDNSVIGDIEAGFSAFCAAIYLIVSERLLQAISVKSILFWVCLITSLGTLVELIIDGQAIFPSSLQGWISVIILGFGIQVIGWGGLMKSLKILPASVVSMQFLVTPIIAYIGAWLIFAEKLNLWQIAASILILLGVYISLTNAPQKSNS